jgi:hypothetical protein
MFPPALGMDQMGLQQTGKTDKLGKMLILTVKAILLPQQQERTAQTARQRLARLENLLPLLSLVSILREVQQGLKVCRDMVAGALAGLELHTKL